MAKDKKQNKRQKGALYAPSMLRRTYKTWLYNLGWLALFSALFFGLYSIDKLCLELDRFTMLGDLSHVHELVIMLALFWFWLRSFFRTINVLRRTINSVQHENDVIENPVAKRAYEGIEGTGKTINTANDVLLLASEEDRKLRLRYFLMCPFAEKLKDDLDFKAVKESYEYYKAHPDKIPHLMLNFKMKYKGREQYDYDEAYINQEKRIAEGFVIGLTEAANLLPNSESKMGKEKKGKKDPFKPKEKTEFLSLSRQFTATKMVYDEQRTGEVFLPLRSVTGSNFRLDERRKVLPAHFLQFILDKLEDFIQTTQEKTSKFASIIYTKLADLIEDIGFYVFTYTDKEAIKDRVKSENNEFVIPCDIPFEYDTRGERYKYRLFAKTPE